LLYSTLNPYGVAPPLVTAAQVAGMAIVGAAGGLRRAWEVRPLVVRGVLLGATGAMLTLVFDLLTNVATGLVFGQMKVWILGGIPFSLVHIGWNAALFASLGPAIVAVLARYRARLSPPPRSSSPA
jgi:hypothetical protein